MTPELDWHDVGVVVFMRAPGVDARDAAARAEWALRRAIRATPDASLTDEGRNGTGAAMPVVDLMEVGMAAGNGYLWLRPTPKAARERGLPGVGVSSSKEQP
jgi:hypothetical protein